MQVSLGPRSSRDADEMVVTGAHILCSQHSPPGEWCLHQGEALCVHRKGSRPGHFKVLVIEKQSAQLAESFL